MSNKKLPILAVFAWFLILGEIQDGDHVRWRHRPSAASQSIKFSSFFRENQRLSTEGKIFSKYRNISETHGRDSINPHPPTTLVPRRELRLCVYFRGLNKQNISEYHQKLGNHEISRICLKHALVLPKLINLHWCLFFSFVSGIPHCRNSSTSCRSISHLLVASFCHEFRS